VLPKAGPGSFKTYQLLAPRATHHRPATCQETGCKALQYGWKTVVDESAALGQAQAHYIRRESGRKFREDRELVKGLTIFVFDAGQTCFNQHTAPLERDPMFIVKDGDYRGNPRGTRPRVHKRAADWVEDFAEHQSGLANELEKG
jgi:hypothetical protein